jgi:hypothetical protein
MENKDLFLAFVIGMFVATLIVALISLIENEVRYGEWQLPNRHDGEDGNPC